MSMRRLLVRCAKLPLHEGRVELEPAKLVLYVVPGSAGNVLWRDFERAIVTRDDERDPWL